MRDYEVTVVLQPELDEQAREELLARVQSWMVPAAAEEAQLNADHWGMRQLAYPILKHERGYYVLYSVQMDPAQVAELERNLTFTEDILRYLVVRQEA